MDSLEIIFGLDVYISNINWFRFHLFTSSTEFSYNFQMTKKGSQNYNKDIGVAKKNANRALSCDLKVCF